MDKKNLNILTNIIGGVETGGQIYGKRNYASYVAPGKNTANEKTCTLGWAGNYGERAKRLCKMILEKNPAAFRKADTAGIEKKLSANWETTKWHPTAKEKAALIAIITTTAGKECQDALFQELMQSYLKEAEAYGVTDIPSQMMWCEIQHLGGIKPVKRIFGRAKKPYTPDTIYASLLLDQKDATNNNQVGDKIFQSRHACCVKWIKKYVNEEKTEENGMISNCGHDENRKYTGGKPGDQKGDEWAIIPWYSRPWTCVLRHRDPAVRKAIAKKARAAANNNKIGYCQGHRLTYWEHLKASNYDPSQITVACEADCSSGVAANIRAVGIDLENEELKKIPVSCTTRNLRPQCDDHGFDVLTDKKYLDSPDYLLEGDILLCEGHHVATNLTTGSKAGGTTEKPTTNTKPGTLPDSNVKKGQKWLNSCYGTKLENYLGEKLETDGIYGEKSRAAAVCIWKDVSNRKNGSNLNPANKNFLDSCKKAAKKATIKQGASGTFVYLVEFVLSAKGFYFGAMDASFGSGLTASVKSFQKEKGLTADGVIGPNTWYKLFN